MAESGSASNDGVAPSTSPSSAAAAPDWEMLTMSMSSSALGKPHGNDLDNASEKSNPQIESPSNPSDETFASDVWMAPLHASINQDSGNDAEAEPFTEGWKPHLSTSGLYGYAGERNRQDEVLLSRDSAETYFDSNSALMGIPEGLLVSDKADGDAEKRVLAYGHSADKADTNDVLQKEKAKGKGGKQPKKSSKVIWSLAVAATVVGIVFLGQRLHAAYHQNQQLQIQLATKDEKLNELLLQMDRLKEVVGNHRRMPVSKT